MNNLWEPPLGGLGYTIVDLRTLYRQSLEGHRKLRETLREQLRDGLGGGGRSRSRRGDVRAAILTLLAERPMHGYEMIQEIADRSHGLWRPSPGSVYPTLQLLVDEGLIAAMESDGSKKLFELTDDGRAAAEKIETPPWQHLAEGWKAAEPNHLDLTNALTQLMGAVGQAASTASADQQERIIDIVNAARRDIYGVLGES
ncbi:PadR family transcriptional regulator [[Mycobacterium] wendilense]|uniref:PadR family transcriptional regulator n=1 Tax=[Mycobacterium] wendilense TaxID=3064284 RepID=A0ABM9MHX7_9MYCO|nr:PadR family transcriptional regulator [Mycolicibacterium sp. MU0050]CAJ1585583.1 PadR family transcriptional regulator [Mycolicibacterium sp. MU0050]